MNPRYLEDVGSELIPAERRNNSILSAPSLLYGSLVFTKAIASFPLVLKTVLHDKINNMKYL